MTRQTRPNLTAHNPFAKMMGIEFMHCADGECAARIRLRPDHLHGGGVVHGGVAFSLADTTMATGLIQTLERGQNCATIELKISYFAAVVEGEIECHARILRQGKSIAFTEATVYQGEKTIAKAHATFAIVGRRKD